MEFTLWSSVRDLSALSLAFRWFPQPPVAQTRMAEAATGAELGGTSSRLPHKTSLAQAGPCASPTPISSREDSSSWCWVGSSLTQPSGWLGCCSLIRQRKLPVGSPQCFHSYWAPSYAQLDLWTKGIGISWKLVGIARTWHPTQNQNRNCFKTRVSGGLQTLSSWRSTGLQGQKRPF